MKIINNGPRGETDLKALERVTRGNPASKIYGAYKAKNERRQRNLVYSIQTEVTLPRLKFLEGKDP